MSDEHFDEEFDQLMQKVIAIEKEVAALKGPQNRVVLTSPNGQIQISVELFNSGLLQAFLFIQQPDGSYTQQPTERKVLHAQEQPTMKNTWYFG